MGTVFTKQRHLAEHQIPSNYTSSSIFRMKCLFLIVAIASATALASACDCCTDECLSCQRWVQNGWKGVENEDAEAVKKVTLGVCKQLPPPLLKPCTDFVKLHFDEIMAWIETENISSL